MQIDRHHVRLYGKIVTAWLQHEKLGEDTAHVGDEWRAALVVAQHVWLDAGRIEPPWRSLVVDCKAAHVVQ